MLQKLTIHNFKAKPLTIGIEPWADVEVLPPGGRMDVEVENAPDLGVSVDDEGDGEMSLGVMGNNIRLITKDAVRRYTDETGEFAPQNEPVESNATWRAIWGNASVRD